MISFSRLVRTLHVGAVASLFLPVYSYLSAIATAKSAGIRIASLVVFLILSLPLWMLILRVRRQSQLYPPHFVTSHPFQAAGFAAMALVSVGMLLAAVTRLLPGAEHQAGGRMLGPILFGVGLAWLTVLAQEISFRINSRAERTR